MRIGINISTLKIYVIELTMISTESEPIAHPHTSNNTI